MLSEFGFAGLAALSALVFFAGIVDSLAGGGGLITLPAYLAVGLNPSLLLGTNKLASSIGTTVSAFRFSRHQRLDWRPLAPVVAVSLAGSWLGAALGRLLSATWLRLLLLAAIPVVGVAVFSRHSFGRVDRSGEFTPAQLRLRAIAVALPIGAYDGFFGPGTGTFLALAFTRLCRFDLVRATAWSKILNLASNLSAMAAFLWMGRTHWPLGLSMGGVSVAGHYVGSQIGIKRGASAIRPMILWVCAALFVKLLLDLRR